MRSPRGIWKSPTVSPMGRAGVGEGVKPGSPSERGPDNDGFPYFPYLDS